MQLGNLNFIKNSEFRNYVNFFKKILFDLKNVHFGYFKVFFVSFDHFEYNESFAQSWVKNTK